MGWLNSTISFRPRPVPLQRMPSLKARFRGAPVPVDFSKKCANVCWDPSLNHYSRTVPPETDLCMDIVQTPASEAYYQFDPFLQNERRNRLLFTFVEM